MARFICEFHVTDDYTYFVDYHIPVEYSSQEAFMVHLEEAVNAWIDDNGNKDNILLPEGYPIVPANFVHRNLFVEPELFTFDEWLKKVMPVHVMTNPLRDLRNRISRIQQRYFREDHEVIYNKARDPEYMGKLVSLVHETDRMLTGVPVPGTVSWNQAHAEYSKKNLGALCKGILDSRWKLELLDGSTIKVDLNDTKNMMVFEGTEKAQAMWDHYGGGLTPTTEELYG